MALNRPLVVPAASWKNEITSKIYDSPSNAFYHVLSESTLNPPPARTFNFPLQTPTSVPSLSPPPFCPQCALRFKFCHGTNCLTNRIFATSHRRSKLDISLSPAFSSASSCAARNSRESHQRTVRSDLNIFHGIRT